MARRTSGGRKTRSVRKSAERPAVGRIRARASTAAYARTSEPPVPSEVDRALEEGRALRKQIIAKIDHGRRKRARR